MSDQLRKLHWILHREVVEALLIILVSPNHSHIGHPGDAPCAFIAVFPG